MTIIDVGLLDSNADINVLGDTNLKIEAVCLSETLASTYKSTRRHSPEDQHRHLHRRENLKSHKSMK
jgi:hypothetical protein